MSAAGSSRFNVHGSGFVFKVPVHGSRFTVQGSGFRGSEVPDGRTDRTMPSGETQNPQPTTRNPEPGTQNPELGTGTMTTNSEL
jgi:hypothetical protein